MRTVVGRGRQHLDRLLAPVAACARGLLTGAAPSSETPRRALLYTPGSDERKCSKAATQLDADVVVLDCEDGVAMNKKQDARHTIARLLTELDFGRSERAVRINPPRTDLAEDDLHALVGAPAPLARLQALVAPKINSVGDVEWLFERVRLLGGPALKDMPRPPALVLMCESAVGLLNLRSILEACRDAQAPLRVEACILGGDDMAASICAQRTRGSQELLFARQQTVLTCRAYGVQPIDIVQINFQDQQLLQEESREGASMGFAGKQVIHPAQVQPVQAAFSPSAEQLDWAVQLVAAFEAHQGEGRGAFVFNGHMIDMPTLLQAKNLLALAARF